MKAVGSGTAVGLAGCLGGGGNNNDTSSRNTTTGGTTSGSGGTVVYLTDRGGSSKPLKKAIDAFEQQSDYTVDLTFAPKGTSMNAQLAQMEAAGNLPSMVFETSTDAYRRARQGQLAPVTDLVNELGIKDPVQYQGESYHAPAALLPLMSYYRTDILESRPQTRAEYLNAAKRIEQNQQNMHGTVIPSGRTNNATTQMVQNLWLGGVDIYSGTPGSMSVTIDQGQNRTRAEQTYAWLKEMADQSPNANGWGWGDTIGSFYQGNAATIPSVSGLPILQIRANRPELENKIQPMPFPPASGNTDEDWWGYMEGHLLFKNGPNLDGAREFIKFFMQSKYYFQFLLTTPLFNLPTKKESLSNEQFTSNNVVQAHPTFMDIVRNNWERFHPVLQTGDNGTPNIIAANAYGKQLFGQSVAQLLFGGMSPAQTVDWIAGELRSLKPK